MTTATCSNPNVNFVYVDVKNETEKAQEEAMALIDELCCDEDVLIEDDDD